MRDRLIDMCENLILSCKSSLCNDCEHNKIDYPHCMGVHFADYLLANGVIVPPCKVGDTVYFLDAICGTDGYCINNCCCIDCIHAELQVFEIDFDLSMYKEIGNTVFLTKEEAEAKLKELKENAT